MEAYKKTGLTPLSKVFIWRCKDKSIGGCGLTALYLSKTDKKPDETFCYRGILVAQEMEKLGYDWAYLQGFTCGFDGKSPDMLQSFVTSVGAQTVEYTEVVRAKATAGFEDGTACFQAMGSPKVPYHTI